MLDFSLDWKQKPIGYEPALKASFAQYQASNLKINNLADASLAICGNAGDDTSSYSHLVRAAIPWHVMPQFLKVGAIRSVEDIDLPDKNNSICSGVGLPAALLKLYNPERKDFDESQRRRNKLQDFIREIMNDRSAADSRIP